MVFVNNNMVSKEWTKYGVKMSMTWNSENRMTESVSQNIYSGAKTLTRYKYDHEGNRVVKSSNYGEVVTPSAEISYRNDSIVTKHIFVSGVRVASKVCDEKSSNVYYQSVDHLGSTNVLTDAKGNFYEHVETFPDGTVWVKEFVNQSGVNTVFTSHEMYVETKFFYAKARYYDAQLGRFISVDRVLARYMPIPPVDNEAQEHNKKLPGMGGVFNPVNMNLYHYAANNPLKYVDPDGNTIYLITKHKDKHKHSAIAIEYKKGKFVVFDFYPDGSVNAVKAVFDGTKKGKINKDDGYSKDELSMWDKRPSDLYKDNTLVDLKTDKETDAKVLKLAEKLFDENRKGVKNKFSKFKVKSNNCTDFVEELIQKSRDRRFKKAGIPKGDIGYPARLEKIMQKVVGNGSTSKK